MAWLADIAGKAEGILNQLDQSAATALHKPSSSRNSSSVRRQFRDTASSAMYTTPLEPSGPFQLSAEISANREARSSGYASSISSLPSRIVAKKSGIGQDDDHEKLLNFLNDADADFSPPSAKNAASLSRRSSDASLRSLPALTTGSSTFLTAASPGDVKGSTRPTDQRTTSTPHDKSTQRHSTKASNFLANEDTLEDLKFREANYQKTLQSKDSQLAVLRVRLQDVEQQMQLKTQKLTKLEAEQRRLHIDSAESNTFKVEAFESLEKKLKEAELEIERERKICKKLENEFLARIQRLEYEQSDVLQQLTSAQKMLTDEKIRCNENAEQLKLAKYNLESNKLEFDEYKQKATRILQSKEKLIATLKSEDGAQLTASEGTNLLIQLEELKTERDLLKEDLQQAHLQLFNFRGETQELESHLAQEQRAALEQQRHLQDQCQTYQQSAAQYREQYEQLKQDYQYVQDEMRRQHAMFPSKLREKDAEISRLINQVTQRPVREINESEAEIRIRQLTENLIQKQTIIEALQTDKQTLTLQLERLERLYREAESAAIRASSTVIDVGLLDDGIHSRIPAFLRETPQDTGVTRGVKKAYSTVEKFSVRFGMFLRRYPVARVFLLAYAILLHLWVMVVLFTYTPEIHSADYSPAFVEPKIHK